jgi:hypothetical protein
MKTFELDGINYRIVVKKTNSKSNYNRIACLYREGERTPLMGYTCKESTSVDELRDRFILSIKREREHPFTLK